MKTTLRKILLAVFGMVACAVTLSCSETNPKLVTPPPPYVPLKKVTDYGQTSLNYNVAVDILLVVDDSGSMAVKQSILATNFNLFLNELQKFALLDYHIGVVTSTVGSSWGARFPGDGKLVGQTKFVDRNTPNMLAILQDNFRVGTGGSGTERFFEPVRLALTPPALDGWNAGFYRPDAYLMTVFITDAEDQSSISPQDFYDFLLKLKAGQKDKIFTSAVIIPTTDHSCDRSGEDPPYRTEEFIRISGGTQFGLCDPDYGQKMANLGKLLVERVSNVVLLTRAPTPSTIEVKWGTQIIPNAHRDGWTYEPRRNALILGDDIQWSKQPAGTKLEVNFVPAEYDNTPSK